MMPFNKQQGTQTQAAQTQAQPAYDPFGAVGDAQHTEKTPLPVPGVYPVLYCQQLKMKYSEEKRDWFFIAEFDVIESDVESRPKGTAMSWVVGMRHKPSAGNVRAFLAALNGIPIEEVDGEGTRACCGEQNPCNGRLVRLEASQIETRAGNPFTKCRWVAIDEEMQKNANELRAQAGYPPF